MIKAETPIIIDQRSIAPSEQLAAGEIIIATNTGTDNRVVIGNDSNIGNPNLDRTVFPYRNTEILSENSPRVRELFSMTMRDRRQSSFLKPTNVQPASQGWSELKAVEKDGGYAYPLRIRSKSFSAKIDYQIHRDGIPVRTGVIRALVGPAWIEFNETITLKNEDLDIIDAFDLLREPGAITFLFQATEQTNFTMMVRKEIIAIPAGSVGDNAPPVWITEPDLGVVSQMVQLVAEDPDGYPVTYLAPYLPNGFSIDQNTGVLNIAPSVPSGQEFTIEVEAFDGVDKTRREFTLRVNAAPVWVTPSGSLGDYATGTTISHIQLVAEDSDGDALSYSVVGGNLPAGLSMTTGGRLSGMIGGDGVFTVRVTDGIAAVDRSFSLTSNAPPVWVTPSGQIAAQQSGNSINFTFDATDIDNDPLVFSVTPGHTLPAGLNLSTSGVLTGTPSSGGAFSLRVSDGQVHADRAFSLSVNAPPVWVTPTDGVGPLTARANYSQQLVATDADGDPLTYTLTGGALPAHLSLSSSGLISGGPVSGITPEVLEFPIGADTLVEVSINNIPTTNFLVNGEPYNPPMTVSSNWQVVATYLTDQNPVTPPENIIIRDGKTFFRNTPTQAPFVSDGDEFVPVVGQTYTITYKARVISHPTNGYVGCFRPAFDALRTIGGAQDSAMGVKSGFGYNPNNDLIESTSWVVGEWYHVQATWTPTVSYSRARGRLRINRHTTDPVPVFSDGVYEVESASISVGMSRPPSLVSLPAPTGAATIRVVTKKISDPATVVDNITYEHRPVNELTNSFTVRVADNKGASASRTFNTTTNVPLLPPIEAFIVENQSDYDTVTVGAANPEEIFNQWSRFDGPNYFPSGTTPTGDAASWSYDNGAIRTSVNSSNAIGFVSPDELTDFKVSATLSSTDSDDDVIGIICAFKMVNGVPTSIVATRNCGGFSGGWSFVRYEGATRTVIEDHTARAPRLTTGGWRNNGHSRVEVERIGRVLKIRCSQFGSTTFDPVTEVGHLIPASDPLAGPCSYGYMAQSQPLASFSDIVVEGALDLGTIFDISTTPHRVKRLVNGNWVDDLSTTVYRELGYTREVTNPLTQKVYLVDGPRPYSITKISEPEAPEYPEWLINYDHTKMTKAKAAIQQVKTGLADHNVLFVGADITHGLGANSALYGNTFSSVASRNIIGAPTSADNHAGDKGTSIGQGQQAQLNFYDYSVYFNDVVHSSRNTTVGGYGFDLPVGGNGAVVVLSASKHWNVADVFCIQGLSSDSEIGKNLGTIRVAGGPDNTEITAVTGVSPSAVKKMEFNTPPSLNPFIIGNQVGAVVTVLGWRRRLTTEKRLHFVNGGVKNWTANAFAFNNNRDWCYINGIEKIWSPSLTFVMLGETDARVSTNINVFKSYVQQVITKAKITGDVVLCVPPSISPTSETSINSAQYRQALIDLATSNDIPLMDTTKILGSYSESVANGTQSTALYPNQAGHNKIAEGVAFIINDLIDKTN